ncbi:nuclease-related domain-containing protein [Gracilibacillus dipsosauri]|uniref:NERD domain-containing protein n=2 Tax=Gracilibacillus dipsosauri TaxID=178340 RepID=A0A317KUA7_9BACI|nr:nuclease-related domain-containing protein [Gracilibacillus dipsosauri]PWU67141.1 hypothetical protein DLJ74_16310 [Gracilibacillus dipsosauri]
MKNFFGVIMMFIKNVEKPITIALLEALIYRLKQPPPRLEAMLKGLNQGFRAERELLYYLERARVFKEDVFLLHDLRLPANGSTFFQIDFLLLTPLCAFILEVKSQPHYFIFNPAANQFRLENNAGNLVSGNDPIAQVEEQVDQLRWWIAEYGINHYPIYGIAALANPRSTVIAKSNPEQIHQKIMHFPYLKKRMKIIQTEDPKSKVSIPHLKRLAHALANAHCPPRYNWCEYFEVNTKDIQPGVICPNCFRIGMQRKRYSWYCNSCHHISKNAHHDAFRDFFSFFKPSITNKEARWWLQLDNRFTTHAILKNMNLESSGETRGRVYYPNLQTRR